MHGERGAVVGFGCGDNGFAVAVGAEFVVEDAEGEVGGGVVLNEVELILYAHEAESVLFLQLKQCEVGLHLKEDHLFGEVGFGVVAHFEFHAVGFQEFKGFLGIFDRNFFCHFCEA